MPSVPGLSRPATLRSIPLPVSFARAGEAGPVLLEILADEPVAYWPLQGDTPLNDYSGNGHHLSGSSDPPPSATGEVFPATELPLRKYGVGGLSWDASSEPSIFGFGAADSFTIAFWAVTPPTPATVQNVITREMLIEPWCQFYVTYGQSRRFDITLYGVGDNYVATLEQLGAGGGDLVHVAFVVDKVADTLKVFLNGVESAVSEDPVVGLDVSASDDEITYFGRIHYEGFEDPYLGDLGHVALFDKALTPERILAHYEEVVPA